MKFADHVLDMLGVRYDAVAAQERLDALCATFIACLPSNKCISAARALRRCTRYIIRQAMQSLRAETKLSMTKQIQTSLVLSCSTDI